MSSLVLSQKGQELIDQYKSMVINGYWTKEGKFINSVFSDFELNKFKLEIKDIFSKFNIDSVLDYGSGGSSYDVPLSCFNNLSFKDFFNVTTVYKYEPSRNIDERIKADCVVCFDVLEHLYIVDVPAVIEELFQLSNKALIVNVGCYKASAVLPCGENAHTTVRSPYWWKGIFDVFALKYPEVQIKLWASQAIDKGLSFNLYSGNTYVETNSFSTFDHPASFAIIN